MSNDSKSQGFTLWQGFAKSKTYNLQDKVAEEYIRRGGTAILVHKYIGPVKQSNEDPSLNIPDDSNFTNELSIQDIVLGENRDRKYDPDIIELRGVYTVIDSDLDLSQFGLFLSGDNPSVEFHLNDHIRKMGRRLMPGDVLEFVHLRDDTALDENVPPVPKYYVITDVGRSAPGYGSTWLPHIWKTKTKPVIAGQEFNDLFENRDPEDTSLGWLTDLEQNGSGNGVTDPNTGGNNQADSSNTYEKDLLLTKMMDAAFREQVKKRSFEVNHLYIRPSNSPVVTNLVNWIFNDDAIPPNFEGDFIASGKRFPQNPTNGQYFIRTDYSPERLFKRVDSVWKKIEDKWRIDWVPAHRILESYINNENITSIGPREDQTFKEKQALSKIIRPKPQTEK